MWGRLEGSVIPPEEVVVKVRATSFVGTLALMLVASLGIASLASAAQFRAEEYPTPIAGSQTSVPVIATNSGNIKCSSTVLTGNLAAASGTISVSPSYSGCKAFGVPATVNTNSCQYALTSTNESAPFTGSLEIACAKEGDAIEFSASTYCSVKLPAQKGLGAVSLENTGTGSSRSINLSLNVTGLTYIETGPSCASNGTFANGTFTGAANLSGYFAEEARQSGIYLANSQVQDPPLFTGESLNVQVAGAQTQQVVFSTNLGSFKCTTFTASGKITAPAPTLRLAPQIGGCKVLGLNASVEANGCYLSLRTNTKVAGTLSVGCASQSSAISIAAPGCNIQIPIQSHSNGLGLENTGSGSNRGVLASYGISAMKYTESGSFCPTPGTHTNGSLYSAMQLMGEGQGLWVA